jgi:hypothetical protein
MKRVIYMTIYGRISSNDDHVWKALYSNRSASHLELKNLDEAVNDARKCISCSKKKWAKAWPVNAL